MKPLRNKLTNVSYRLRLIIPDMVFLLLLIFASCSKIPAQQRPTISNPVPRPLIAVDVEIDTPPDYTIGHTVALALANKIDELATRVNSAGLVIFVCRISSNSWDDCPVSFKTPAVAAWVLPPAVPVCGNDPYACSNLKKQYQKDFAAWKVVHAGQERALEQTRAYVHTLTDKIRTTMKFQWDNRGSDIFGALATGAQNLQGINAQYKYLLLATDFISTTTQQGSFSLAGCRVVSVFRTASSNAVSQQSNSYWSNVARSAGAVSFTSYSVSQSEAVGLQLPSLPA